MGSSSSFTVGLLNALWALQGRMPSKRELAREAIRFEQDVLRETVGSQDQVLAAFGGFNHVTFLADGDISVRPVTLPVERIAELDSHLMLFYTGIERIASDVASSYVRTIEHKARELRIMRDMVDEALSILASGGDLQRFGILLDEAWQIKRGLSSRVTNTEIDDLYAAARSAGAIGGKITGAGGGGFLLLFVPPDSQVRVRERLADSLHVPFRFESRGSEIIFADVEQEWEVEQEWKKNLAA